MSERRRARPGELVAVAVFHLLVTPVARVLKALGVDPLRLRLDPRRGSYFTKRD